MPRTPPSQGGDRGFESRTGHPSRLGHLSSGPPLDITTPQQRGKESGMTLQEALEGWFLHLKADNASPRTLDRYQRVWRQFGTWLSERAVSEIGQLRAEHLRLYVLARLGEVSAVTAQYEVSPIKSFTSWLEEMEFLPRDPF